MNASSTPVRSRIIKNITLKGAADVLARIFSFVLFVVSTRILGDANFGLFSYALALTSVLVVFTDIGWNTVLIREFALHRSPWMINAILKLKGLLGTFVLLILLIVGLFTHVLHAPLWLIGAMFVINLCYTFQDFLTSITTGLEKMEYESIIKILPRLLALIAFGVFLWIQPSLFQFTMLMLVATLLGVGSVTVWFLKKVPESHVSATWSDVRTLMKMGLPFGLLNIVWIVYIRQDLVLLGQFNLPLEQIGYYATASRLLEIGRMAPIILQLSIIPVFSSLAHNPQRIRRYVLKLQAFLLPLVFLLGAGFYFGSSTLVRILFKPSFAPAAEPIRISGLSIGFILLSVPILAAFIALKKEKIYLLTTSIAMITNLLFNLVFIPRWSYMAPAWALITSEAVAFVFNVFFLFKFTSNSSSSAETKYNPSV